MQQGAADGDSSRVVTFDLFSALTDSRRGATAAFTEIGAGRGWSVSGEELYDVWDRYNKEQQRHAAAGGRTSFRQLSIHALRVAYDQLGLRGRPDADLDLLWRSVARWPLWGDVEDGVAAVAARAEVGILSNVDDELVVTTRAYRLVDPRRVLTSERLGAFKPSPAIYLRALQAARMWPRRRGTFGGRWRPGSRRFDSSARDTGSTLTGRPRPSRSPRPGSFPPPSPTSRSSLGDPAGASVVLCAPS